MQDTNTRRHGREMSEDAPSPSQSALLFGVIAAVGAGLYYVYTRRRDLYAQTYPSGERSAVRRLYEAHREEHEQGSTHRPYGKKALHSPEVSPDAAGYVE